MPPTLTRGQWTRWGSGHYGSVQTISDGTLRDVQNNLIPNGTGAANWGTDSGQNGRDLFIGWCQGGCWDTTRSQWIAGLGNAGYPAFDLNVFDVPSGTWNPAGRPQRFYSEFVIAGHDNSFTYPAAKCLFGSPSKAPLAFVDVDNHYPDVAGINPVTGTRLLPNGGHHGGSPIWMPSVGRMAYVGTYGTYASDQGVSPGVWEWDPVTKTWALDITGNDLWPDLQYNPPHASAWDSRRNRVLSLAGEQSASGTLFSYDPARPLGSRITRMRTNTVTVLLTSYFECVYDPIRDQLRVYAPFRELGGQFGLFNFSSLGGTADNPTLSGFTVTGGAAIWGGGGILYDPVADRDVVWVGGGLANGGNPSGLKLYVIHPDTHVSTTLTPGGDDPGTPSGGDAGSSVLSIWNRFEYLPTYDAYAIIPRETTSGVYLFAPDRASGLLAAPTAPVLACTDILSGPRTGNSDTAFGQVAGQDGAYVTVYGFNFGNPEDTLTATLGGVAMRVIDRGQATGARSPATLYNPYMTLQMAVLQVPAAAPLGASILTITVNSQAAISPDLTFTVIPGTIRFVATAGLLQSVFDGMTSGDITYVKDNVSLSTLFLRTNTQNPSGQLALVAYPSAAVVLGNTSNDGILLDASGAGANCTFAKLNIRGSNAAGHQAVTVRENGRIVGCNIQVPGGFGSSGAVGMFGSNLAFLANECTNCGATPADQQYHVVYRYGRRGVPEALRGVESGFRGAYNYFHGNDAARAFNLYNDEASSNQIGDHELDHNVIVDQQYAGLGFLGGVVGTNSAHDNLLIRCGLGPSGGQGIGVQVQAGYTFDWIKARSPITVTFDHNTLFNCGDTAGSPVGALYIDRWANYSFVFRNNIIYQLNGLPYVANAPSGPLGPDATKRSHNLWFGAGAPPAFDSAALNVDPLLVSVTTPLNLHLQATSQARAAGLVIGAGSFDLDGKQRPATAPDLGAYQFAVGGIITPPPTPTASLALVFNGLTVDRVGQGGTALGPDGANDGVVTVTLTTSDSTPKTITAVMMKCSTPASVQIGHWNTTPAPDSYVLGVALTPSGALVNNPTTMGVNFTVASGGQFSVIGSDVPVGHPSYPEFAGGNTLTVTATCADGTTAVGSVVIGAGPPSPTLASLNPSTGPGGVQVTLLGSNFSGIPGGNTVRFGTTPATIVSESVSAIVVLAPPLADATYLVTVTTADGTSNGLPFQAVTLAAAGHGYPAVRTRYRRWS